MAVILCLETATTNCSVAIGKDGELLALQELNTKAYSHAEKLHVFIETVLKESGIKKEELNAIAISKGPGSYTGLRIGVSAAKGLCFALGIPLISVPTLQSLARQAISDEDLYVVSLIDARRMEAYTSVFDAQHEAVRDTRAEILDANSFSEYLNEKKTIFLGDGAEKLKTILTHPNAVFLDDRYPSAKEMITIATEKYKISDTEDVAYFEPYYFKEFKIG